MSGYCAACGKRAPTPGGLAAPDIDPRLLEERRWLCVAARPLRGENRDVGWNLLCPRCLARGRPFALRLLDAWGVSLEWLEKYRGRPGR